MTEIRDYYSLSKRHANSSFKLAVYTCIIGILIMTSSIVMYFLLNNSQTSIITAISGGIVEVFAGTALWVHRKSLEQLNHYYNSLHSIERFLSTVNLVDKLKSEKQDEMYIEIIRNEMKREDKPIEISQSPG